MIRASYIGWRRFVTSIDKPEVPPNHRRLVGAYLVTIGARKFRAGAVAGLALGALSASPVEATSPDRSWLGIRKILIISQATSPVSAAPGMTADDLCRRVQSIASIGAPVPVACAQLGDPDLRSAQTAVLSFQATVSDAVPGRKLLLFTVKRAAEGGLEPGPIYFGATPRAVPFANALDPAQLDQAIRTSLSELLPWLNQATTTLQPERKGNW